VDRLLADTAPLGYRHRIAIRSRTIATSCSFETICAISIL
jgi:hypothetical protein